MDAALQRRQLSQYVKALARQREESSSLLPFPEPLPTQARKRARHRKLFQSLDLFTGAGGLSIGLERAGFKPALAVEISSDACETFNSVFPDVRIEPKPVDEISFRPFEGIDLVVGGPPCQPFSSGGKGLAAQDDRDMIPQFIRAIEEAAPRAFLMENVSALFGVTHQSYLRKVFSRLASLGYELSTSILNAAEYGVPQKRRRGFIVGLRKGRFEFPKPTHGSRGAAPFISVGDVLNPHVVVGDPNESRVFYAKKPDLRPSPYDGQLFNGGGRPIDLSAPCHTILAAAGGNKTHFLDTLCLVPEYHAHLRKGGKARKGTLDGGRRITIEESALIQTFDPSVRFAGSRSSRYTQIGNAVPPRLAENLGRAVYDAIS